MAQGLALPVRVDASGGAKLLNGSLQVRKLLTLAFSEGEDSNPFQDIGFTLELIFQLQAQSLFGQILDKVNDVINSFDGRIKLAPENPVQLNREVEGELEVAVRWLDPETEKEEEFRKKFTR